MAEKIGENEWEKSLAEALDRRSIMDADPDCPLPETYREFRIWKQKEEGFSMKKIRKRMIAAAVCAAILLVGTVCAFAAVPALREYLHLLFLQKDNTVAPLTEVPDGWTGIYTVDDLEAVRDNLDGNYILMCDIHIPDAEYEPGGRYENGFLPIGEAQIYYRVKDTDGSLVPCDEQTEGAEQYIQMKEFRGNFNGNGHVLSNIHIRSFVYGKAGLFSSVVSTYILSHAQTSSISYSDANSVEQNTTQNTLPYDYDMSKIGGVIKNLGIEDSSIIIDDRDVQVQRNSSVSVGMIAGKAATLAGCYVKNVTIDIKCNAGSFAAGGLAGEALLVDSCYARADIKTETHPIQPDASSTNYIGGVAGISESCITSYFDGTIITNGEDCGVTWCDGTNPPIMINLPLMEEIFYRLLCYDYQTDFDREEMLDYRMEEDILRSRDITEEEIAYLASINWFDTGGHIKDMMRYAEEYGPEDMNAFQAKNWLAFYAIVQYRQVQDFFTYPVEGEKMEYPFFLDPWLKPRERRELSRILSTVFTDEEFIALCQENGIKYGCYDNYDLRYDMDRMFAGFDTDYIWYIPDDGYPVQRLFLLANSSTDANEETEIETAAETVTETENVSDTDMASE